MTPAPSSQPLSTEPGASIYSPLVLALYDWWVLGISNRFAWKCPSRAILQPFYKKHMGRKHLDVGVGTGFYLAHADLTQAQEIALLDLNANSLRAAAARLARPNIRMLTQDVMRPSSPPEDANYDSISLFYLLHCLPGTMKEKGAAIANLKQYLAKNGVLYGATILGDEAEHNAFGRLLMRIYNRKGIFSNRSDTIDGLREILQHHFKTVEIRQHNKVALFVARSPIGIEQPML